MKGNDQMAILSIQKIFLTDGNEHMENDILSMLKATAQKKTSKVSLGQAYCSDERYTRASWVNFTNIIFHELTGINVIL